MLYYLDELLTAMNATPGRSWFNIASAVLIVVIFGAVAWVGVSSWVVVPGHCIEFVCYGAIVASWARKDAFEAYRQKRTRMRTPVIPFAQAAVANSLAMAARAQPLRKVPIVIYSSTVRRTATVFVLACVTGSTIVGLVHEPKTPPLAWTSLGVGAVALVVVLAIKRSPKRDAGLFAISGMGSGVFMGASTAGFPGSLPMWLWTIGAISLGTMALIVDAEATQNKSVNRP